MSPPSIPQRHFHKHETPQDEAVPRSDYQPRIDPSSVPLAVESSSSDADFSTGNTPSTTRTSDSDADYSPPMSTELLPGHPSSAGLKMLIEWIDSISDPETPTKTQNSTLRDMGGGRAILLQNKIYFTHSDLSSALIHAIESMGRAHSRLSIMGVNAGGSVIEGSAGFTTGMPLITLPWEEVGMDQLGRMSTMAVRSGLLQASNVLQRLNADNVAKRECFSDSNVDMEGNETSEGVRMLENGVGDEC